MVADSTLWRLVDTNEGSAPGAASSPHIQVTEVALPPGRDMTGEVREGGLQGRGGSRGNPRTAKQVSPFFNKSNIGPILN